MMFAEEDRRNKRERAGCLMLEEQQPEDCRDLPRSR